MRRIALGAEHVVQVPAGVGIVRLYSQGFLELADCLVHLALLAEGDAEVIMDAGVIRCEAEDLLVLADCLVQLAFARPAKTAKSHTASTPVWR